MKFYRLVLLTILSLLFLFSSSWAWQGKVVGVSDGDTISVMHDGKAEKIRLYGIDTPEKGQDFGQGAKQFTSSMVFGKSVDVTPITQDRYNRTVAIVSIDGEILNRKLIESGLAWLYERYCKRTECQEWKKIEEHARKSKIGLWSIPSPVAPWEFRSTKRPVR